MGDSLHSSLGASLHTSLYASLRASLYASLRESLNDSLSTSLNDSLGESLGDSLHASLGESLGASLHASLNASLHSSLGDSLNDSLGESLGDSLHASLYASLHTSLYASLHASLRSLNASLHDSLSDSLRESLRKCQKEGLKFHTTYCWGQLDMYWIAYYLFCKIIGAKYLKKDYKLLLKYYSLAKSCNWIYFFEDACILVRKPQIIKLNSENKMHCDGGPAIEFRDGWKIWALNDVTVQKEIAETPADKLDPMLVLKEKNVEVRREILRKIGIERFVKKVPNRAIDKHGEYELLAFKIKNKEYRALKMKNPSIGVYHIEGVPSDIKNCKEAIYWRNGENCMPLKLT